MDGCFLLKWLFRVGLGKCSLVMGLLLALLAGNSVEASGRDPAQVRAGSVAQQWGPAFTDSTKLAAGNLSDGKRFPSLWIGSVRYSVFRETSYSVDQNLSLFTTLTYSFQIIPQVGDLRHPELAAPIPNGYYLLRIAVLLPDVPFATGKEAGLQGRLDPLDRYVTSYERLVVANQNSIKVEVPLKFSNISATSVRNRLLIQLTPIEANHLKFDAGGYVDLQNSKVIAVAGIVPQTIDVPFAPFNSSSLEVPPENVFAEDLSFEETLDLANYIPKAKARKNLAMKAAHARLGPDNYARAAGLKLIRVDDPSLREVTYPKSVSAHTLATLMDVSGQSVSTLSLEQRAALCALVTQRVRPVRGLEGFDLPPAYYIKMKLNYPECMKKPLEFMTVYTNAHVEKIDSPKAMFVAADNEELTVTSNFAANRSRSSDTFSSFGMSFSVLEIFGQFKPKIGVSFGPSYTINETNSRSQVESGSNSASSSMSLTSVDIQIPVEQATVCVAVLGNEKRLNKGVALYRVEPIYICDLARARRFDFTERYYHALRVIRSSAQADPLDPRSQSVNLSFRGIRDYLSFRSALTQFTAPSEAGHKVSSADTIRAAGFRFEKMAPAQSGVISIPARFDDQGGRPIGAGGSQDGLWQNVLKKLGYGYRETF